MLNKIKDFSGVKGIYTIEIWKNKKIIESLGFHNEIQSNIFNEFAKLISGQPYDVNELKLNKIIISSADSLDDYLNGSPDNFEENISVPRIVQDNSVVSNYLIAEKDGQFLIKSIIIINNNNNIYSCVKLNSAIDKRSSSEYGLFNLVINRKDIFDNG